ncbi:S-adenosyl-L-methionine-dependent methyltransferase, partial [Cladochytrium replicatum]
HYLLAHMYQTHYHAPIEHELSTGIRVLDVGTGTGVWLRETAAMFPQSHFYGVDIVMAPSTVESMSRFPNVVLGVGDVLDRLPFQDGTFDYVFQRQLVRSIPADRWIHVVSELLRVLKPGGWIEVVESDMAPLRCGELTARLFEAVITAMTTRGIDPRVGGKLDKLLHQCGLVNVASDYASAPLNWQGELGGLWRTAIRQMMIAMRPFFASNPAVGTGGVGGMRMTAREFAEFMDRVEEECKSTEAYLNYFWAVGRKPLQSK